MGNEYVSNGSNFISKYGKQNSINDGAQIVLALLNDIVQVRIINMRILGNLSRLLPFNLVIMSF
jgi:hypothetical protein